MTDSQPNDSPIRSILLVDLSHCFWSIALGGRNASPNNPRDSVVRLIRSLASGYDRTAIAVDGKKPSFRSKIWPRYKSDRKARPDHLWSLLGDTARHLGAAGFHLFEAPDTDGGETTYEADDVIGSLAEWAVQKGIRADILSGDSDLCQLVDDTNGVRYLRNYKGIQTLDAEGVKAWVGVYPAAVVELKALAGDGGDGYGDTFPGVGEKLAIELLKVSGWNARVGVEKVVSAVREYQSRLDAGEKLPTKQTPAPSKVRETIASLGIERLEIGYSLAAVCRDVPLDFDSLASKREPEALPELGSRIVPDAEPEPIAADDSSGSESAEDVPAESVPVLPHHVSALATTDATARMLISPAEAKQRLREFAAMIKTVLIPNVDYGKIKGCGDKDVLAKSGAEKLAEVYGFAASFKIETRQENWSDDAPLFYYLVRCTLRRKSDRAFVGDCLGSCNSKEKKYAARWVYDREVPPHLDKSRIPSREYQGKTGPYTKYRVPNEEIFDLVNTVLKMAEKRAFVGVVLIATRASGEFTADLDDLLEAQGDVDQAPQWEQPPG